MPDIPTGILTRNDMDRFWRDDEIAHRDNCFYEGAPQLALGIRMSDETVFSELGEEGNPFAPLPQERRLDLNRRYNDLSEKIVGRRLLYETAAPEDSVLRNFKRIGEVFGGRYFMYDGSEWLESDIRTPQALEKRLDKIDRMDLREFLFPANWEAEKKRVFETYGARPRRLRHVRGPITLMCSIYGTEDFILLGVDEPELARRFSQTVADVAINIAEIMDEEAGLAPDTAPTGFSFADDNCCLMTPELYENLGLPVLLRVFERFSPGENDRRYQHSDSLMGHLLPLLGQAKLNGVNFGPTVLVDAIRKHLPKACIDGCLAPFTLMRNDTQAIHAELIRDFTMSKALGKGVNFDTAGSINDGSSLASLANIMAWIQAECRY